MENLKIDENGRNVTGGITNDASEFIKNLRVNPTTGRVLVDAVVSSTNTSIGSTIPGGTQGSILFLGAGSTLAQDNANLFYDDTNNWVGFGTNTPDATLEIDGTFHYVDGNQQAGYVLTSDANGNATWQSIGAGSGITSINGDNAVAQTLTDAVGGYITIIDAGGGSHTFGIDIAGLTSDSTFITDIINIVNGGGSSIQINLTNQVTGILPIAHGGTNSGTALSGSTIMISNGTAIVQGSAGTTTTVLHGNAAGAPSYSAVNLATDVTGLLDSGNIDITQLEGDLDLGNIAGQIDLTTQVTGELPLANGGTGASLSDPNYNAIMGWDDTDNAVSFWHIGSGLSYDHSTHTLSSSPVVNILNVTAFDDFVSNFQVGAVGNANGYALSGNFQAQRDDGTPTGLVATTETNHPGIFTLVTTGQDYLTGFYNFDGGGVPSGSQGLLTFDNDFDISMLVRLTYSISGTDDIRANFDLGGGTDTIGIAFRTTNGTGTEEVAYDLGAGFVSTAAPFPSSGQWFTLRFLMVSGTLTVTWDANTIYSANPGFTDVFGIQAYIAQQQGASTVNTSVDYVTTNYQTTR